MANMSSASASTKTFETVDVAAQLIRILAARHAGLCLNLHDASPAGTRVEHELGSYSSYANRLVGHPPSDHSSSLAARAVTNTVLQALPESCRLPAAEARDLLERHGCNAFGINGPGSEDVASASFVGFLQLFNHSCKPNAVFDHATPAAPADAADGRPPAYAIIALDDIPAGKEICISYLSYRALVSESAEARRAFLKEQYGFDCMCDRCCIGKGQGDQEDQGDGDGTDEYAAWLASVLCPHEAQGCGSGVGVPILTGGDDESGSAQASRSGLSTADTGRQRRCVHCARVWGPDLAR